MAKRLVGLAIALTVGAVFAWLTPMPVTLADPPEWCYILIEGWCVDGVKRLCSEVCGDDYDCRHAKVWAVYMVWVPRQVAGTWPGSQETYFVDTQDTQDCKREKHCEAGFPCSNEAYAYLCVAAGCYSPEDELCKFDRYGTLYVMETYTVDGEYCTPPEE